MAARVVLTPDTRFQNNGRRRFADGPLLRHRGRFMIGPNCQASVAAIDRDNGTRYEARGRVGNKGDYYGDFVSGRMMQIPR
jgi:hypothetical protein